MIGCVSTPAAHSGAFKINRRLRFRNDSLLSLSLFFFTGEAGVGLAGEAARAVIYGFGRTLRGVSDAGFLG